MKMQVLFSCLGRSDTLLLHPCFSTLRKQMSVYQETPVRQGQSCFGMDLAVLLSCYR